MTTLDEWGRSVKAPARLPRAIGDEVGEAASKLGQGGSRGTARLAEDAGDVAGQAGQAASDAGKAAAAGKARTAKRTAPPGRGVHFEPKG